MTSLKAPAQFVLFGDSNTQFAFQMLFNGWGAQLATAYERKADVINRGFSGYNTRWALCMLEQILDEFPVAPALMTVSFGSNDCSLVDLNPKQHVPLDEFHKNSVALVRAIQGRFPSTKVLVLVHPPLYEPYWASECSKKHMDQSDRSSEQARVYARESVLAAQEAGVPYVDVCGKMEKQSDISVYLRDGLHYSTQGNNFVFKLLKQAINDNFPELVFESLPWHYPYWGEVDNTQPEKRLKSSEM